MNLDKLKELGRRHELRDEWRKAIDAYQRVLAELAEAGEPGDPSLHNRIGDLALKAGDMGAALRAYGAAADTYADQGFFNNAIAVCGKILRVAPTRTATYLRLADLHARKNVVAEARRNLTEYVERMIASGHVAEAVEPLREFATRFSASAELRATLADLLREIEPRVQEERLAELAREMDAGPGVGADGEPTGGGTSSREPSPARGTATGIVFLDTAVEPVGVRMVQPTAIGEDATPEPVPVPGFEPTHAAGPEPSAVVVEPLVQTEVPAPVELPGLETRVEFTAPASADLTLEPLSLEPVPLDLAEEPPMAAAPAPPQPPEPMFEGLDVPEPELERETEGPPEPAAELDRLMEAGRWSEALAVVNTLLARSPDNLTRHRQRVELAYRVDDREELVGAYLGLARALERAGAGENAVLVYRRVLEHDGSNAAAAEALARLTTEGRPAPPEPEGGFVDLGALILEPEPERDTRMRVDAPEPVGDEDRDFRETLEQFKAGLSANIEDTDFQTHYDLGIAFKEMGLLTEAISQFQRALRSPSGRLRSAEALGQCFHEQGRHAIAEAVLGRAVEALAGEDDAKIGLIYWWGRALEALGRGAEARRAYERALAVDITFLDLNERIQRLSREPAS